MKWSNIQNKPLFFLSLLLGGASFYLLFSVVAWRGRLDALSCIFTACLAAKGLLISTDAQRYAQFLAQQKAERALLGPVVYAVMAFAPVATCFAIVAAKVTPGAFPRSIANAVLALTFFYLIAALLIHLYAADSAASVRQYRFFSHTYLSKALLILAAALGILISLLSRVISLSPQMAFAAFAAEIALLLASLYCQTAKRQ